MHNIYKFNIHISTRLSQPHISFVKNQITQKIDYYYLYKKYITINKLTLK